MLPRRVGACTIQLILESLFPSETRGKTRQATFLLPAQKNPCASATSTLTKMYASVQVHNSSTAFNSTLGLQTCQENHKWEGGREGSLHLQNDSVELNMCPHI